ncbi:MAG: hypothetical protein NT109_01050 [Flavobacteriia bacterium]|nr:hypothetical protein [Flavobacteriia bacterium]
MKPLFSFLLIFNLSSFFAQPDVFEAEGLGNREIEPSYRLVSSPKIIDSIKVSAVKQQPLLQLYSDTKIHLDTIEAATIETTEKIKQLYPFYAKVGIGSTIMPLGELFFNSTRSRSALYGAHVKHLSSFGDVKNRDNIKYAPASFDKTSALVFGKFSKNNITLGGNLNYENYGYHNYGIQDENINADSIGQRINRTGFDLNLLVNQGDSARLNLAFDIAYRNLTSKSRFLDTLEDWKAKENSFLFNTRGWFNKGTECFYGNIGIRYNGYKYGIADSATIIDTGIVLNNTIIDLYPGISSKLLQNKLNVDVGVGLSIDVNTVSRAYIYPRASISYSLLNDLIIPFIGIRGGLNQTTFDVINRANPYVLTNVLLANENKPYDLFFGVRGGITKQITYGINASFARVNNKAFFVTDTFYTTLGNQFSIVYDSLNLTTLEGCISYQLNEKLKIDGVGRFYSYEMMNEAKAWNLPQLQFTLRGSYNLYDKFLIRADLTLESGRMAKVVGPGNGVIFENNQYFMPLGFIADGNLGVEYRYSKRVSAFLQINNLASQRYSRWLNYPVMPIQVMAGITARF